MKFVSHSENETKEIGKKIAAKLKGGEILALQGNLGAGKTMLAKGIAEGLGYEKIVNSPTFVLMKIYKVKSKKGNKIKNICHIDSYRISANEEIEAIGALEYLGRTDTVSLIEWPERIKKILPKETIFIHLKYGRNKDERIIE